MNNLAKTTDQNEEFEKWLHKGGEFFEEVIAEIGRAIAKKGDHVIDVGANHGFHTFRLARSVGWMGKVTAVEALPDLAARLKRQTRWMPQVKIVAKAISFKEGATQFKRVHHDEGWSGIRQKRLPKEMMDAVDTIVVPMTSLDAMRLGKRPLSFIKIDVEGGEFDVIKGGLKTITKHRPFIVLENSGVSDAELYCYTIDEFLGVFKSIDYEVFDLFGRPFTPELWSEG